jgi:CHASE3 domain sensor protein
MLESEQPIEPSPMLKQPALHELQQQIAHLSASLVACLTGLLLLSIVLAAFLSVQDYFLRRDLTGARKLVQEYETNRKPLINAFIAKLQAFAQTNPDFQPILQKYGIPLSPPFQPTQPAPAQAK